VIKLENIHVNNHEHIIKILFTPTIPHCSMATLIGLCLRVKLLRSLPDNFKVDVEITPGTHNSEESSKSKKEFKILTLIVNKQLNDKERVAAALENTNLLSTFLLDFLLTPSDVINNCIAHTD
jgi:hypothetical protein